MDTKLVIEVLCKVRSRIKNDENVFICFALNSVLRYAPKAKRGAYSRIVPKIKAWVVAAIAPHSSYGEWVDANYPRLTSEARTEGAFTDKAKEARLAWLDCMIAHPEVFK